MKEPIFQNRSEHQKGWGIEVWIVNNDLYCGKILEFDATAEFSMHYHLKKDETFFVLSGLFKIEWFDLSNADRKNKTIRAGEVVRIPTGVPHKIYCIEKGSIIEISTTHEEEDSYRVEKGDSQK